ncbi:MAG: phosphatase PAP2 family protein [Oligoflexia bacterium]|nr:phosphatase PAP2 family protein [Oligoflexia bacterium]
MKNIYKIAIHGVLILAAVILISYTGLDIRFSSLFYDKAFDPPWPFFDARVFHVIYHYGTYIPVALGVSSAVCLILGFFVSSLKKYRRRFIFAVLLFVIAPGFIVQTLKGNWGRPRPGEILEFGGKYQYRTPFEPEFGAFKHKKNDRRSFPSGHSATGFYMLVIFFIYRRHGTFWLGVFYGIMMGLTRIVQGAHFLSDIVTSFFVVYICGAILSLLILRSENEKKSLDNGSSGQGFS